MESKQISTKAIVLGAAGGLLGAALAYHWYTKEPRIVEFTDK